MSPLKQKEKKKIAVVPWLGTYKQANPPHSQAGAPFLIIACAGMKDAIVWKGMNMGSMLAPGSKVIARAGPFLSGTAPFV